MEDKPNDTGAGRAHQRDDETLYSVIRRLISEILFPDASDSPLLQRIKTSIAENGPLLPEACRNTGNNVLLWTRRGSPLRALLVISVSRSFSLLQNRSAFLFFFNFVVRVSFDCLIN